MLKYALTLSITHVCEDNDDEYTKNTINNVN